MTGGKRLRIAALFVIVLVFACSLLILACCIFLSSCEFKYPFVSIPNTSPLSNATFNLIKSE